MNNCKRTTTATDLVEVLLPKRDSKISDNYLACRKFVSTAPDLVKHKIDSYLLQAHELEDHVSDFKVLPICDGLGQGLLGPCSEHDAMRGAMRLFRECAMFPEWSDVVYLPLGSEPNVVSSMEDIFANSDTVRTISSMVIDDVEEQEHRAHALGYRFNQHHGYGLAIAMMMKRLVCLMILTRIPTVEARPVLTQVTTFIEEFMPAFPAATTWTDWFYESLCGFCTSSVKHFISFYLKMTYNIRDSLLAAENRDAAIAYNESRKMCTERHPCGPYNSPLIEDGVEEAVILILILYICALILVMSGLYMLANANHALYLHLKERANLKKASDSLKAMCTSPRTRSKAVAKAETSDDDADLERVAQPLVVETQASQIPVIIKALAQSVTKFTPPPITLEMSIKGSYIQRTSTINGVMLIASMEEDEHGEIKTSPIGLGFRHSDYFVTANHNLEFALSKPGVKILVPFHKSGNYTSLASKYYTLPCLQNDDGTDSTTPDFDSLNIVPEDHAVRFDVAILKLSNDAFSKLDVKNVNAGFADWKATVTACGLSEENEDGQFLHGALGSVVENREGPLYQVQYNCSTLPGWSGGPVLSGKKVIAVHTSTNGKVNYGTNFAVIQRFIALHERRTNKAQIQLEHYATTSPTTLSIDSVEKVVRDAYGHESDFDDIGYYDEDEGGVDLGIAFRNRHNGRVTFRERVDWARYYDSDTDSRADSEGDRRENAAADAVVKIPVKTPETPLICATVIEYEGDEEHRATSASVQAPPLVVENSEPDYVKQFKQLEEGGLFKVSFIPKATTAPRFAGLQKEAQELMNIEKAIELGYEQGKFSFPVVKDAQQSKKKSSRSLYKHLMQAKEIMLKRTGVDDEVRSHAIAIVVSMMKSTKYQIVKNAVNYERIVSIINSTAIKGAKSPGLPFSDNGLKSNAEVIEQYGVKGLAELVMQHYNADTWVFPSSNFMKFDATKQSKIDEEMERNIQGNSLITRLVVMCHLGEMQTKVVENYRKTPIMCGFSPLKQGDAEYMLQKHKVKPSQVLIGGDIKLAEFVMHSEDITEDVTRSYVALSTPSNNMTEDEFQDARHQMYTDLMKANMTPYFCSNGVLIEKMSAVMLSTGQFDTFTRNSFAVLLHDVRTKLEMGYTEDQINKDFVLSVGGDDNLQNAPKTFDYGRYKAILLEHGVVIHKEAVFATELGLEFFSFYFDRNNRNQVIFKPARFSKHVEGLKATKLENLPEALVSHMTNWVHDVERFSFFRQVFMSGREAYPDLFKDSDIPDRMSLINHLRGIESVSSVVRATLKKIIDRDYELDHEL